MAEKNRSTLKTQTDNTIKTGVIGGILANSDNTLRNDVLDSVITFLDDSPIVLFSEELTFDDQRGKFISHQLAGNLSFTLAATGNINGAAIVITLLPDSASTISFSADFVSINDNNFQNFNNTKTNDLFMFYDAITGKVKVSIRSYDVVIPVAPVITSGVVENANPNDFVINLSQICTGTTAGWTPKINGTPATKTGFSGSGSSQFIITVSETVVNGDTLTVDYDQLAGDTQGTSLPLQSVTNQPVTNNVSPGDVILSTPNLQMYFDGDDDTTFTLTGNDVDQWDDKSPSANHLTGTGTKAVRNATNQSVEFQTGQTPLTNNVENLGNSWTIFVVENNIPSGTFPLLGSASTHWLGFSTGNQIFFTNGSGKNYNVINPRSGLNVITYQQDGTSGLIRVNKSLIPENTNNLDAVENFTLDDLGGFSSFVITQGDVRCIAGYNRALTAQEISDIEDELITRFSIP